MTKKLSLNQLENELGEYRKFVEMFDSSEAVLSEVEKAMGMVRFIFDHAQVTDEVITHSHYFEVSPSRKKVRKHIDEVHIDQFLSLMRERDDQIFTHLDMLEYFGCSYQYSRTLVERLIKEGRVTCARRGPGTPNLYIANT